MAAQGLDEAVPSAPTSPAVPIVLECKDLEFTVENVDKVRHAVASCLQLRALGGEWSLKSYAMLRHTRSKTRWSSIPDTIEGSSALCDPVCSLCWQVLDEVRPYLVADGGNVKVMGVDVEARVVSDGGE